MQRIILKYGLISGVISSALMLATLPLEHRIGIEHSYYVGYTVLVLSFLLVFFGVRSYRDTIGDGSISFGRAFTVGIAITAITSVFYVLTWECLYFTIMHNFMNEYGAYVLDKARASGASAAVLQAKAAEIARSKQLYENPLYNAAITFLEPFPVGLVITLISSAVLRRKPQPAPELAASW